MKQTIKLTEEKIKSIISECIKHYIREGHWDDETDPVKLAEMYKHCLVRFDNAIETAIKQKGGIDNIKQGDVILTIRTLGWRYYDSEHKALRALKDKYFIPSYKKDAVNSIQCFFRSSHSNYNHEYIFVKGNEKPSNLWGDISRGW
jgi:hypothetical protein